jgi:hypothetical protein
VAIAPSPEKLPGKEPYWFVSQIQQIVTSADALSS